MVVSAKVNVSANERSFALASLNANDQNLASANANAWNVEGANVSANVEDAPTVLHMM